MNTPPSCGSREAIELEAIARIIDPLVFELNHALDNADGEPPELRRDAEKMRDERLAAALSKAGAIQATLLAYVANLETERDEARANYNEAALARDGAGFLGSVADCINYLDSEAQRLREGLEWIAGLEESFDEYTGERDGRAQSAARATLTLTEGR